MKFKEYIKETVRTLPDLHTTYRTELDVDIVGKIAYTKPNDKGFEVLGNTAQILNLVHMRLGMYSEICELIEALHRQDRVNVSEELADILWYISNDITTCGRDGLITRGEAETLINYDFKQGYQATDGGMLAASQGLFMWLHAIIYNTSRLADTAKRYLAYGSSEREKKAYIGTMEYLLAAINNLAYDYRIDLEDAMDKNIAKLRVRYPHKFDEDKAVTRNLEKEREVLEAVSTDNEMRKYPLTPDEASQEPTVESKSTIDPNDSVKKD